MLRRLGIRGKVLAALAGPVLALMLIAGLLSWQSASVARSSGDSGVIADLLIPHADVVIALQGERTQATALAAGRSGSDVDTARAATDRAIAAMAAGAGQVPESLLGGRITDLLQQVANLQAVVDLTRGRVVSSPERAVDTGYTRLIADVVAMPLLLSQRMSEPDLAAEFRAYGLALTSSELLAHEMPVVRAVLLDPEAEIVSVRRLPAMIALTDSSLDSAAEALDELGERGLRLTAQPGALRTLRQSLSSGLPEAIAGADASQLALADAIQHQLGSIRADLIDLIDRDATASAAAANQRALLTAGAAIAAVLLSLALALTIARGIVRPMRSLTKAAGIVRDELPRLIDQVAVPGQAPDLSLVQIPVTSHDEVGRLAAAFNEVNATTIQVAQEQAALRGSIAEMFVNVARRDQVLLNRQLSFIDALERSEEDPKVLADLFRLDHLATRMRRNAESLLVLAGIDTGRRLRDTLPLSDVIRTASSEIEHYERVLLDLPADPLMLGHTALPAAHLLAELIENATMFSDPGAPVHVSTGRDETHVLITVTDQGLGMTEDERVAARKKIASASAGEVLGAQHLGMFVVGRIAARLGAEVELSAGPGGTGTRAMVRLPLTLFVGVDDVPMVAPVMPAAAPEVASRPVDLAALTDGATGLGLPRRRTSAADDDANAPSTGMGAIPVVDPAASTETATGLPRRGAAAAPAAPWAPMQPRPTPAAPHGDMPRRGAPTDFTTGRTSRPIGTAGTAGTAADPTTGVPGRGASTIPAGPTAASLAGAAATLGDDWSPLVSESTPLARRRRGQHVAPSAVDLEPTARAGDDDADDAATPHPWEDGSSRRPRNRRAEAAQGGQSDHSGADKAATADEAAKAAEPFGNEEPDDRPSFGGGGLPSRTPVAPVAPSWPPKAGGLEPVAPETRASMFSGFRSRRAELIAEQLEVRAPEQLAAPAVEQIEPEPFGGVPEPFGGVSQPIPVVPDLIESVPEAPVFVIPGLVEDDDFEVESDRPLGIPVPFAEADDTEWASPVGSGQSWDLGVAPEAPAAVEQQWSASAPAAEGAWAPAASVSSPPAALPASWASSAPEIPLSEPASGPAFSSLVAGEIPTTSAAAASPKRRRGFFGRRTTKDKTPSAAAVPSVLASQPAVFEPVAPAPQTPDRQSVWSAHGSHVQPTWSATDGADAAGPAPVSQAGAPAAQELSALSVNPALQSSPATAALAGGTPAAGASWMPNAGAVELSAPAWPSPAPQEPRYTPDDDEGPSPAVSALPDMGGAAKPVASLTPEAPAGRPAVPSQHGFTTFVPSDDARDNDPIALRAGIAQQALAELSQLSSYRPQEVGAGAAQPLVRRTPVVVPKDEPTPARRPAAPRDANEVRSLLASFQSGTTRGRTATPTDDSVTTPNDDAQQGTSW